MGTAREGVQNAGSALGNAAEKAKVPALAVGAGLAGLAGGVALASRNSRKRVLGVPVTTRGRRSLSKNLAEATKNARSLGEGMGSLASEVRTIRQGVAGGGVDQSGSKPETRRSPIEVVLQGLTKRR